MAAKIGSLFVSLVADMSGFQTNMNRAAAVTTTAAGKMRREMGLTQSSVDSLRRSTGRGFDVRSALIASKGFETMNSRVALLRGTLLATTAVFGGLTAALGANILSRYADQFTGLQNSLRTVSKSSVDLAAQTDAIRESANRARSSLTATATLYSRLAKAAPEQGAEKLMRYTETVNKALQLGGATAAEAESAAVQFSQAIQSNRLGGEELRAVLETPLGGQLAKGLGVTIAKMREMSEAGQLTSSVVLKALEKISGSVDESFNKSVMTLDQSLTVLDNNLTAYVGQTDKAYGITKAMAGGIGYLAENLDSIVPKLGAVVGLLATGFVGRRVADAAGGVRDRVRQELNSRKQEADAAVEAFARVQKSAADAAAQPAAIKKRASEDRAAFADPSATKTYERDLAKVQKLDADHLAIMDRKKRATQELSSIGRTTTPEMVRNAREIVTAEQDLTKELNNQQFIRKAIDSQSTKLTAMLGQQSMFTGESAGLKQLQADIAKAEGAIAASQRQAEASQVRFVEASNRLATLRANDSSEASKKIIATLKEEQSATNDLAANQRSRQEAVSRLRNSGGALDASSGSGQKSALAAAAEESDRLAAQVEKAGKRMQDAQRRTSVLGKSIDVLKGAGGSLIGFLGGPWGVAFTGVVAGMAYFAAKSQEAKERTSQLESSMRLLGISFEGTGNKIEEAGNKLGDFTAARLRQEIDRVKAELDSMNSQTYSFSLNISGPESLGDIKTYMQNLLDTTSKATKPQAVAAREAAKNILDMVAAIERGDLKGDALTKRLREMSKIKVNDGFDKILVALGDILPKMAGLVEYSRQMNGQLTNTASTLSAGDRSRFRATENASMDAYNKQLGVAETIAGRANDKAAKEALETDIEKRVREKADKLADAMDAASRRILGRAYFEGEARKQVAQEDVTKNNDEYLQRYVDRVVKAEYGNGNVYKNPNSSASGAGQFIDSTWLDQFKKVFPERAANMGNSEILELRRDMDVSRRLIESYAKENSEYLRKRGIPGTESNLHLSHFLGVGDAAKVLQAAPGTPLQGLISPASIRNNKEILGGGRTVDDAIAYADKRANADRIRAGDTTPTEEMDIEAQKEIADIQEERTKTVYETTEALKRETEAITQEGLAIGATEAQKARDAVLRETLADLAAKGIVLTDDEKKKLYELAQARYTAVDAADKMRISQERLQEIADTVRGAATDGLGTFIQDLRNGKSATEALTNALGRMADRLLDLALNMAMDGIFGQSGTMNGLGGAISKVFAGVHHGGGDVGFASRRRSVPASAFVGAPRFHSGLGSKEFAAILEKGESVMTQVQKRDMASTVTGLAKAAQRGGGGGGTRFELYDQRTTAAPAVDTQRSIDKDGQEVIRTYVRDGVRAEMGDRGSDTRRQMDNELGSKPVLRRR